MNDPRGSTWKKCDLHIHTPASIVQNYGGDTPEAWERFISDLESLPSEFKIIGINDYLFIDGYKKVLGYKSNGRLPKIELILPVLEFRLKKFAGAESNLRRINFHVIFSDQISPEVIHHQFLNALYSKYKLAPGHEGITWSGVPTRESLCDLGRSIKSTVPPEKLSQYGADFEEGFNNLTLEEDDIIQILSRSTYFTKRLNPLYLTAIGKTEWESLSWSDGSIADKKDVINKVDLVFISAGSVEHFHNARNKLKEQNVNHLLLDCSDAKHYADSPQKDRIGKCFTWVKADSSFEGLQYVLYESESRIFVGDVPPIIKRVNTNRTKYIKAIKINHTPESSCEDEIWFKDISIDLNKELVAIIGNKGNGKSALSDVIGLVGNTKNYKHLSFLNVEKFRDTKNNKAKHFKGSIEWESGDVDSRLLSENPAEYDHEKIKYFPQKYLEILCSAVQKDEFEKELKNVIFSHVLEEERLGMSSLDELIQYQSEVIDEAIFHLKEELNILNKEIIGLEDILDQTHIKTLEENLKSKRNELRVHEKSKPDEIKQPETDEKVEKKLNAINKRLQDLSKQKSDIEKEILEEQKKKADLMKKKAARVRISGEVDNFKSQYDSFVSKIENDLAILGLSIEDISELRISTSNLDEVGMNVEAELALVYRELNMEDPKSLVAMLSNVNTEIDVLRKQLDEPNKRYQEYLKQLEEWETKKAEIIGAPEKDGSIAYYETLLKNIAETYPIELKKKRDDRLSISRKIYRKKKELLDKYKLLYQPVESFMSQYKSEKYPVNFDVVLELRDFYENFFLYISQKAKGSFYGVEDGFKRLSEMMDSTDINIEESFIKCIEQIIDCLEQDDRDGKKEKRVISHQVKKDILGFYNFLFGIDYLMPRYNLKLGDTELLQLSPGEKGALLLIFYLLIDKNDIPLIMDQPEENLDNQSVYELLVQYIKEAKKRRQIIIVTHNPNLAVVCDAEQIIYARINKTNKNVVSYETGSIENPTINRRIIDVLEGTMPAFSNRDSKYTITRTLMT